MKKIVHELSEDELVRLAQQGGSQIEPDQLTEAGKFIFALGIRHGDKKISAELVYHTYREWREVVKPQSRIRFFRDFKKYFESFRGKHGIYYLLDSAPFDLSQENYFFMRTVTRREKANQKAQKTKRSGKKSRLDQKI